MWIKSKKGSLGYSINVVYRVNGLNLVFEGVCLKKKLNNFILYKRYGLFKVYFLLHRFSILFYKRNDLKINWILKKKSNLLSFIK